MTKPKFYHASPARFKKGARLSASSSSSVVGRNYNFSADYVYMTTSPYVHFTVLDKAVAGRWHVYEVVPIKPQRVWRGIWDEWITREIEIVRKVGSIGEKGKGLAKYTSASQKVRTGYRTVLFQQTPPKKDRPMLPVVAETA